MFAGGPELYPVPPVPWLPAADGRSGAGGLAPLYTQGRSLQGGEGQPNLQVLNNSFHVPWFFTALLNARSKVKKKKKILFFKKKLFLKKQCEFN